MFVDIEAVTGAQRCCESIRYAAVHVFDASATTANRMVMVLRRGAEHIRRLAVALRTRGQIAFGLQVVQGTINRRERDAQTEALRAVVNLRGGQKAWFPRKNGRDPLSRTGNVFSPSPHEVSYLGMVRKIPVSPTKAWVRGTSPLPF